MHNFGTSIAMLMNDPVYKLLSAFGYTTFEYTKDKSITDTANDVHPSSANPDLSDILLGNVTSISNDAIPENMYA